MKIEFLSHDAITSYFTKTAHDVAELSPAIRDGRDPTDESLPAFDFPSLLALGPERIFAGLSVNQPKTYEAIMSMEPRFFVGERFYQDAADTSRTRWRGYAFLELNGRAIWVKPYLKGATVGEMGSRAPSFRRYQSLPESIASSYYSNVAGLDVIRELPGNAMWNHVLPADISIWSDLEGLWKLGKKEATALNAALADLLARDELQANVKAGKFRCFVDTRQQGDFSKKGWVLFLLDGGMSRRVYAMQGADPSTIREVRDPQALLDAYVSNVVSCATTDFPFATYLD